MLVPPGNLRQIPILIKLQRLQSKGIPHHWQFSKARIGSRNTHGFSLAVRV
jgi:hypothetical protein